MKAKKSTPKMSGLVIAALRNLRDAHGSTAKEIMKYIMAEYNASEATVQRQLKTALKRGVEYGILKRTDTGYSLNTDAEVIVPHESTQMEACGKKRKRNACKPKRRCPKKKKRSSCMKKKRHAKKRKRNPCNMCAERGRTGSCNQQPIKMVHETTPGSRDDNDNLNENETDKRSFEDDEQDQDRDQDQDQEQEQDYRENSRSQNPTSRNIHNSSRSHSRSKYYGSDMEDDQ